MKELNEYRTNLINRMVFAVKEFRDVCLSVKDPYTSLSPNEWSVHQIATHARDVHLLVYRFRAQRTAQDDNPEFQNFDGDAYMAEHYDVHEPLNSILDGFVASMESHALSLARLPAEAWSRLSRHVTFGSGFTLQTWVERDLAHLQEHLETIKKSL